MSKVKNVLLIDDSEAVNLRNKSLLENIGLFEEIISFSNANNALDFLTKKFDQSNLDQLPEIIFLDIEMPEMNAFEFLKQYSTIQNIIDSDFKPFIIIVSDHLLENNNLDNSKRFYPVGVSEQIRKPVEEDDVISILEEYFDH